MKYAAFLRGINVGGSHKVKMADLKICLESLGLTEVKTYINSGNVLFNSSDQQTDLVDSIEAKLFATFGFKIPTIVRTQMELKTLLEALPEVYDASKSHIVFCEEVSPTLLQELANEGFTSLDFMAGQSYLYLHLPNGVSQSDISLFLGKRKRLDGATMRTYRTAAKLYDLFD